MTGKQGKVIAFRADRLGARLVSLMNAMRIAQQLDAQFACAWTETTGVGDTFNDPTELFDDAFVTTHFLAPETWATVRPNAHSLRPGGTGTQADLEGMLASGQDIIIGNAFGVITLTGEDLTTVTPAFRQQLQRLPFSQPVRCAMQAADTALMGHTAYHIRRGDLTDDLKAMNKAWPHKMVPNEFYEMHMRERLNTSGGVVLFSDDAATIAHYTTAYPAVKTVRDVIDDSNLTEAQRDLVELYAMARCETIIAPERSAFSSTAADLFGAEKLPIGEALGKDLRDQAYQELMTRIETRSDSFAGDGDVGQSLAHVGDWLERRERWQDAARVFADRVKDGLNISFVYPRAMTYLHHTGDATGVVEIAGMMRQRHIVHTKDLVNAEILHGYAHIRQGARDKGLRHIANGFWHGATGGLARNVVPLMIELGWFNHTNFLPVMPFQRTIQRRRGPIKSIHSDLPGIATLQGVVLPDSLFRMETAIWDFSPMLRSLSINAAVRTGAVGQLLKVLERAEVSSDLQADLESQQSILRVFQGGGAEAAQALETLAKFNPDRWQIWQRLSHAHWVARDIEPALEAALRALACLPDAPVLRAWAGMIQLRAKAYNAAIENLRLADAAETGLPCIPAMFAHALKDAGDPEAALDTLRRARALAPHEAETAMFEARLLNQAGRPHEAVAELLKLVEWHRATGKVFILLVGLLRQIGDGNLAAEVATIGAQRFPNHEKLVELGQELAA